MLCFVVCFSAELIETSSVFVAGVGWSGEGRGGEGSGVWGKGVCVGGGGGAIKRKHFRTENSCTSQKEPAFLMHASLVQRVWRGPGESRCFKKAHRSQSRSILYRV